MNAPSLPREPYIPTDPPQYPFQKVCADYCAVGNRNFLIIVDRFSGWIHIYSITKRATAENLIKHCRKLFSDYGTPEVFESDGGPQFIADEFNTFLRLWGVHHRCSSAYYPQSNGRAELGVKSAKKIINDHVSLNGCIDNNKFAQAVLQYRNTPMEGVGLSPAQLLFNRNLRDFIPCHPKHYKLDKKWIDLAYQREQQMANRNKHLAEYYDHRTHTLQPLTLGSHVLVQNKHAKRNLNKWTLSGRVVEILDHRQYKVKMDGSGRVSLRNRRHLRPYPTLLDNNSQENIPYLKHRVADNSPKQIPHPSATTVITDDRLSNSQSNHGEAEVPSTPPAINNTGGSSNQSKLRLPRALSNLNDYNKPGNKEYLVAMTRRAHEQSS